MNNFQKITDKEKWHGLLGAVKFKTFFHALEWEEFLEKEFKWLRFERYIYKDKGLLSMAKYGGGVGRLVSHPFCEYGGILPFEKNFNIRYFENNFKKEFSWPSFKIKFHPFVVEAESSPLASYWLEGFDKKTYQQLYSGFRKTTKQVIEKAKKQGLTIGVCKNKKDLQTFYSLYLGKAKEHNIPAYPKSFFDFFFTSRDVEIVLVKDKNKVIAGSVFLFYSGFLHYFINGSAKNNKGANYLILDYIIAKYAKTTFRVLDFGGTGRGSSLAIFKRGFGAIEKPIYICQSPTSGQAPKSGFGCLRAVWGLLPKAFIRILSPYFLKYKL